MTQTVYFGTYTSLVEGIYKADFDTSTGELANSCSKEANPTYLAFDNNRTHILSELNTVREALQPLIKGQLLNHVVAERCSSAM